MSRPIAKHPTMRDVAALAGVSHQTVSRVINHAPGVTDATRSAVEAAIRKLGYRPHAIARSFAEGRTRTVACLAPNFTDFTYASNMEGAESVMRQHGYDLLFESYHDRPFESVVETLIARRRVDGLILISPYIDLPVSALPADFPLVMTGGCARDDFENLVYLDNRDGARQATEHLLGLGHTRIAQVTGPQQEDCVVERDAGYRMALAEAGIRRDPMFTVEGDWSATSGYDAFAALPDGVSAVVCQNDRMAVGLIRAVRDDGLRVPEDLSVIGFDDMPLASYFDPPLTTMRQDTFAIGRACAERLVALLEGAEAGGRIRLASELVVRASTASASR
jgi:DNA-binding LacI/PurR family transcriptional regulator